MAVHRTFQNNFSHFSFHSAALPLIKFGKSSVISPAAQLCSGGGSHERTLLHFAPLEEKKNVKVTFVFLVIIWSSPQISSSSKKRKHKTHPTCPVIPLIISRHGRCLPILKAKHLLQHSFSSCYHGRNVEIPRPSSSSFLTSLVPTVSVWPRARSQTAAVKWRSCCAVVVLFRAFEGFHAAKWQAHFLAWISAAFYYNLVQGTFQRGKILRSKGLGSTKKRRAKWYFFKTKNPAHTADATHITGFSTCLIHFSGFFPMNIAQLPRMWANLLTAGPDWVVKFDRGTDM